MRRAKILATIGPASNNKETLESMIKEGVDICRINFSFGDSEAHTAMINMIRECSENMEKAVTILQSIQGPKIRMGELNDSVTVEEGETIVLSGNNIHSEEKYLPTNYENIASDTEPGKKILVSDGKVLLEVQKTVPEKKEVYCTVESGGIISSGKGINLPHTKISLSGLTEKDIEDAKFGAQAGVDVMAQSFVRTSNDVKMLKDLLKDQGRADIPVIAKIEKPEALENLDSILDVADGVMVARGDLADEIPLYEVPLAQKKILHHAHKKGKITVVATEMLASMADQPRPTRAEASDVANAVLDGTDILFLSNETSVGKYPLESVKTMRDLIIEAEKLYGKESYEKLDIPDIHNIKQGMCAAAAHLSHYIQEKANVVLSMTGDTAWIFSKFRPQTPIYAVTSKKRVYHKLAMVHNVIPILVKEIEESKDADNLRKTHEYITDYFSERKLAEKGDKLIVITGAPTKRKDWRINAVNVWEIE